jgi:hypothetical protein
MVAICGLMARANEGVSAWEVAAYVTDLRGVIGHVWVTYPRYFEIWNEEKIGD